jgi:hypothetical protein
MLKQKDLDNLLRKIYYTFQQNDKNAIFAFKICKIT